MQRVLLKSKIHRATVTACDLHYVGSLTVDGALLVSPRCTSRAAAPLTIVLSYGIDKSAELLRY